GGHVGERAAKRHRHPGRERRGRDRLVRGTRLCGGAAGFFGVPFALGRRGPVARARARVLGFLRGDLRRFFGCGRRRLFGARGRRGRRGRLLGGRLFGGRRLFGSRFGGRGDRRRRREQRHF